MGRNPGLSRGVTRELAVAIVCLETGRGSTNPKDNPLGRIVAKPRNGHARVVTTTLWSIDGDYSSRTSEFWAYDKRPRRAIKVRHTFVVATSIGLFVGMWAALKAAKLGPHHGVVARVRRRVTRGGTSRGDT